MKKLFLKYRCYNCESTESIMYEPVKRYVRTVVSHRRSCIGHHRLLSLPIPQAIQDLAPRPNCKPHISLFCDGEYHPEMEWDGREVAFC